MTPASRPVILVCDRFALDALAFLRSHSEFEIRLARDAQPDDDELREARVLIARSRTRVDEGLLARAPRLQCAVTATSGFDHVDFAACASRGVAVMHAPNANAASACELTWALILACARRVPEAHRAIKAGEWARERLVGSELAGKTLGVVGLGRIGSRVARVAQAFEMSVIAYDPFQEPSRFESLGVAREGLEELLKLSDVVTFHVPATPNTHRMLNRQNLEYLNRGCILVNASRGTVFDIPDVCEALENGWLRAVGLDVFPKEPLDRNSPLLAFANVVLTPHLGATTVEAFEKSSFEAAEKAVAFLTSGALSDPLPPPAEWYRQAFSKKQ